jgi:uncharacterized membrane protein
MVRSFRRCIVLGVVMAVVLGVVPPSPAELVFQFTDVVVPVPGVTGLVAFGVNSAGDVVGPYFDAHGFAHGFLVNGGAFTPVDVPVPGAVSVQTFPSGVNDEEEIVGAVDWVPSEAVPGVRAGFLFSGGIYRIIMAPFPGAFLTEIRAINNRGQMVGDYHDATGSHGFLLDGGVFTPIDVKLTGASDTSAAGINDRGDIAGDFVLNGNTAGFEFSDGRYTVFDQPACFCAALYGINNRGEIVGRAVPHGFLLDDGVYTFIDVPGAFETASFSINDRGSVVGFYTKLGPGGVPSAPIGFLAVLSGRP